MISGIGIRWYNSRILAPARVHSSQSLDLFQSNLKLCRLQTIISDRLGHHLSGIGFGIRLNTTGFCNLLGFIKLCII
jgi:hypothetical protein